MNVQAWLVALCVLAAVVYLLRPWLVRWRGGSQKAQPASARSGCSGCSGCAARCNDKPKG